MAVTDRTRVLVTGGAGFIGSHVVDAYVEAGLDVVVVDNLATGSRANLNPAARLYEVDIRDGAALDRVFEAERPEIVSHQAAQASVRASMEDAPRDAAINILGSVNVLEACRKHGVRKLIYAATGGAAVGEPKYLPVDEDHPVAPVDVNGITKHAAEELHLLYGEQYGLRASVVRLTNVFGPRQRLRDEFQGFLPIFIWRALLDQPISLFGDGAQERDCLYVDDVVDCLVRCALSGDAAGEVFNVGNDEHL